MSDYDYRTRNQNLDYVPPTRSGNATGAILLVVGLLGIFFLVLLFIGNGGGEVAPTDPAQDTAPAVGTEPAPADAPEATAPLGEPATGD